MPTIEVLGKTRAPKLCRDSFSPEFLSPDNEWMLSFHSMYEWHMGSGGWSVSLFHLGIDVSEQHPKLIEVPNPCGYRCGPHDVIWSHDSRDLFLVNWNTNKVVRYRPTTKRTRTISKRSLTSLQCAPDRDRILLTYFRDAQVVDTNGGERTSLLWKSHRSDYAKLFWMVPGDHIAHVGRPSRRAKSAITFFSVHSGALVAKFPLDPRDLSPYDVTRYAKVRRGNYSLELSQNTWAVGRLLDTWDEVIYEPEKALLYLACYRPTTDPFQKMDTTMCKAEKVWIRCRIAT